VIEAGGPLPVVLVVGGSNSLARLTSVAAAVLTMARLRSADGSVAETTSRSVPLCISAVILC
jgi:hypothetical protein